MPASLFYTLFCTFLHQISVLNLLGAFDSAQSTVQRWKNTLEASSCGMRYPALLAFSCESNKPLAGATSREEKVYALALCVQKKMVLVFCGLPTPSPHFKKGSGKRPERAPS